MVDLTQWYASVGAISLTYIMYANFFCGMCADMTSAPAGPLKVFAPAGGGGFGLRVCCALGVATSPVEQATFEDGERSARPLDDVEGCDVFVVQSLHADPLGSVHDKLCQLLFFIGTLKDAGAARVSAVVPYLAYARQDRQTRPRGPVATRYVAALFEAAGADVVITVDVHNVAAFQNAFRCRTVNVDPARLFAECVAPSVEDAGITVVAPDAGAIPRAHQFRLALGARLGQQVIAAFVEKHRDGKELSGGLLVGDVEGRHAIIVDDMIGTGATIARAAAACRNRGARSVDAVATHGLFTAGAQHTLAGMIDRLWVSDTVPPFRLEQGPVREMLQVVAVAPLLGEVILSIHGVSGSI
ncbi:MAG: ribose-phosphate diphosphokinase [Telluria sp.]